MSGKDTTEREDDELRRARKIAATARDFEAAAAAAIASIFDGGRAQIRATLDAVLRRDGATPDAIAYALAHSVVAEGVPGDRPRADAETVNAVLADAGVSGVLRALKASEVQRLIAERVKPPRSPSGDGTA